MIDTVNVRTDIPIHATPKRPGPVGACWDGHSFAGTERGACRRRATTTIPRDVWASPRFRGEYPPDVPVCDAHAADVWAADEAAATRAEARATSADYLS